MIQTLERLMPSASKPAYQDDNAVFENLDKILQVSSEASEGSDDLEDSLESSDESDNDLEASCETLEKEYLDRGSTPLLLSTKKDEMI